MREKRFRYAIAGFGLIFASFAVLLLLSAEGPRSPVEIAVACGFAATTIPVGIAMSRVHLGSVWWSHRSRVHYAPEFFLLYADVGLTAVLLTLQTAAMALFGSTLFAIIGTYAAHFVLPWVRLVHVVVCSGVIAGLGLWGMRDGEFDVVGGIARVLITLFVVNGTVALHSAYTREVRRAIVHNFRRATTDPLTGLANRRAFEQRGRRLVETAPRGAVVMIVDIDDFKSINDTRGHDHGDVALTKVAHALQSALPTDATVARLGGDEFAVAVDASAVGPEVFVELAEAVAETAAMAVSIGLAASTGPAPDGAEELSTLLAAADRDLYRAKRARGR